MLYLYVVSLLGVGVVGCSRCVFCVLVRNSVILVRMMILIMVYGGS